MVRAWSTANGVVLGQVGTVEGSNELEAFPRLLDLLQVKGCLVTIDAAGCQTSIASKIVDKGGDYLLAVRDNQPKLHAAVTKAFDARPVGDAAPRPPRPSAVERRADVHGIADPRRVSRGRAMEGTRATRAIRVRAHRQRQADSRQQVLHHLSQVAHCQVGAGGRSQPLAGREQVAVDPRGGVPRR